MQFGGAHRPRRETDRAVLSRQLLETPGGAGAQQLRRRRAVRDRVRAVAVPCPLPRQGRQRRGDQGRAGAVPLRQGHLRRRQADGAERGAGVLGQGDARARGDPGGAHRRGGEAGRPRGPCHRHQRHQGGRDGDRRAAGAGWLEGHPGVAADRVFARGRVAVGALPRDRAGRRENRRLRRDRGRHLVGDRRQRSSAAATRTSSIRTSSAVR